LLQQVECEYLAAREWRVLSQGERQRVLIGRALMAKPRVLILDEPCAGLDPAAREHFLQFIQRLGHNKNAPTLILVTHHVEEIMPVFSHLLVLKNGKILAVGEKSSLLKTKLLSTAFAARLRLSNAVPAAVRVRSSRRRRRFTIICACFTRTSANRIVRKPAFRFPRKAPATSWTKSSRCRRKQKSCCSRQLFAGKRASSATCLNASHAKVSFVPAWTVN